VDSLQLQHLKYSTISTDIVVAVRVVLSGCNLRRGELSFRNTRVAGVFLRYLTSRRALNRSLRIFISEDIHVHSRKGSLLFNAGSIILTSNPDSELIEGLSAHSPPNRLLSTKGRPWSVVLGYYSHNHQQQSASNHTQHHGSKASELIQHADAHDVGHMGQMDGLLFMRQESTNKCGEGWG
jgi:hypothetical protein